MEGWRKEGNEGGMEEGMKERGRVGRKEMMMMMIIIIIIIIMSLF